MIESRLNRKKSNISKTSPPNDKHQYSINNKDVYQRGKATESIREIYRYNKTIKFFFVLLIACVCGCNTAERGLFKGEQKTFYLSDYSSVELRKDGTFEIKVKMLRPTTGYYTRSNDTIFMTSKYQANPIVIDSVIFEKREDYSNDSIFVQVNYRKTKYSINAYFTFYNDNYDSLNFYFPFMECRISQKFKMFKLTIGEGSSELITFPSQSFNYLYVTFDYPARPENYLFMERAKFLMKGDTLLRISDVY